MTPDGPAREAGPALPSDPALPFDFAADGAESSRAAGGAPRRAAGAPSRAAVLPTARPRRRVFAAGRIRPPGVVRQEKAARVGRALGKALAWAAAVAGVWAAFRVERRRR